MKDELRLNGNYAGDSAWKEWFALCAVGRCSGESGERLRTQVSSAMFVQLARYGFTRKDACGDDPVAAFDAYFKLKGARDEKKPLKLYFANRINVEGLRMIDFVCGTLFGAISGRIHDIVIFVKIKELLCIRQKEGFIRPYPAVRIYIMYPFFCHIHLISAYRFPRGDYLSVDICKADPVIIYKIQRSYPASCKSLDHVAAHSSYPEDRDTGGCKPFHRFGPV